MECPKCHKNISDDATSCPHCHKVLTLVCPNCHTLGHSSVCEKCGYIILEKCSKCGKMISTSSENCKCGFPTSTSVAYQECESDEFVSISIKFGALKNIRRILGSKDLYDKFIIKLKNLIASQLKGFDGKIIIYNDTTYVLNFNKELSFPTAANKAVRVGLKIINSFSDLNLKIIEELGTPLKLTLSVIKKSAEELLSNKSYESNVKLLTVKKDEQKYLRGTQMILDQYVQDCIAKDYKTDSLYSVEANGNSIMFYEILLSSYILPPNEKNSDEPVDVQTKELSDKHYPQDKDDIYSYKVFDINAKCNFEKANATNLFNIFKENKIISIRGSQELSVKTSDLVNFYESKGKIVLRAVCTEETTYKPWGVLEQLYTEYYKISPSNISNIQDTDGIKYHSIAELIKGNSITASTAEDARFAYIEEFSKFLSSLRNYVVIIEGFENIDDTTIQTLNLYFDKFKKIVPDFVFITDRDVLLHLKIKSLIRTSLYSEYTMLKSGIDSLFSQLTADASDFIQSFYYEKIKEHYKGSAIYFDNAIKYLKEKNVLVNFENKLLIKNNNSVILPPELSGLIRARLKHLSKNADASMILAYSAYLGARLDYNLLKQLGINDVEKNAELLQDSGFGYIRDNCLYINNYNLIKSAVISSIKRNTEEFLIKNILSKLKDIDNTSKFLLLGKISMYKEEYILLWENSQFCMAVGDYDAYLKNCLGSLSLIEHVKDNISSEDIEAQKKEVFQNILMNLYSYSPDKIYSIENILLIDAIEHDDNEKVVKLSNMMLQGALISSNYTSALTLLHNILERMKNPTLLVNGAVNTRFLLLSLVNIEILFNIGDYKNCIETAEDILKVIKPNIIEKIKPAGFSINLFVEHILETFRLAAFAMLLSCRFSVLDSFMEKITSALGTELPDKNALYAIKDFIAGKNFAPSQTEEASPFSKIIYLILHEFSENNNNYKIFAENIYQAKLLASDIHQTQIEMFCDLLIGYSYSKMQIPQKALSIYNDVLEKAENKAIYNLVLLSKYFIAKLKIATSDYDDAILIINDSIALLQENNKSSLLYAIFEKLFVDLIQAHKMPSIDAELEIEKLKRLSPNGELLRLVGI